MSGHSVLMYHAIPLESTSNGDLDYDPHYAVNVLDFTRQMKFISDKNMQGSKIAGRSAEENHVYITFDDGHLTNYTQAFPILQACGFTAEFYINTATVGTPGYVTWDQLREMHKAGMAIESHGHDHFLMNALSEEAVQSQLQQSFDLIAQEIGSSPTVFSPPGGRMHPAMQYLVPEIGFQYVAYSKPGLWDGTNQFIPRYPVLADANDQFEAAVQQDFSFRMKTKIRHDVMGFAKKMLGNNGYERMRETLLAKKQDI